VSLHNFIHTQSCGDGVTVFNFPFRFGVQLNRATAVAEEGPGPANDTGRSYSQQMVGLQYGLNFSAH
jgi:hypothetical protein